jgi:hypothetical protein
LDANTPPTAGYSGTPLQKKLGIKPGMVLAFIRPPADYGETLGPVPGDCTVLPWQAGGAFDLVQYFCTRRSDLQADITALMGSIRRDGTIWISWPKKASKLPTDLDENLLREVILPTGLVDVKVCAVDERWSGLKFVIRKELR